MKNYFHFLFTCALLLVAFIVFNGPESEGPTGEADTPVFSQIEQQAEVNFSQCTNSAVPPFRLFAVVNESFSGSLNHPGLEHFASHQTLFKARKQLYLELKPDLDFKSGQNYHPHSRFEDPPVA